MPRVLRLLALLLPVAVLLPACGGESGDPLQRIRDRKKLIVALEAEFKPFEYVNERSEIVGFDVDLARALAADLGVDVEFRNVKWEAIIPELTSKRADLILSGMTITPERAREVAFSEPYWFTITCLLVAKARQGEVKSIADLDRPDRTIAVKEGTTADQTARQKAPRAKIVSEKTENAAAMAVAQGRADAFLYDRHSVREHHRQHTDTTYLIEDAVSVEPYGAAARRDEPAVKAWVDRVFSAMRKDGRLAAIAEKHKPSGSLEPR
jgi:polar amino acid transport system substrate-binding protein